nr:reverse transcriptase domain-containing protein [Tanacetum cinerariifolium]
CEEYVQEVLRFSEIPKSGNLTLTLDPIISSSSPSFTSFEGSDFILEEIETFLRTPDELFNLDDDYYDTEVDILYLEKLLSEEPYPNLPPEKTEYLKQFDATMTKPSIEEPPELELKELPSHLEYAFLEGNDKLPIMISKELKDEEKSALLKLSLPKLTPTRIILELADQSTTRPAGTVEDVFVKVGKFHFPTLFERPFLRTGRALIDVYSEELTLRVDDEAIT